MSAIFNALPGLEVPVSSISKSLDRMWSDSASKGGPAPSSEQGKATQVNLVLHLGFGTVANDAVEQFATTVRLSKRYPSRVVVLCPLQPNDPATEMRAKIYGECHLGKSKGDTRCCEFVMLSYPMTARRYLEDQVSVCLSTDLPLYYWAHRFSSSSRLADYQYLLRRSVRVMFDSGIVPGDALDFPWPRREAVRDLVYARLLPIRQTIGQFLSSQNPAALSEGLKAVTISHSPALAAEARVLRKWALERLAHCGAAADLPTGTADALAGSQELSLKFEYTNGRRFRWSGDLAAGAAVFEADFGHGPTTLHTSVSLLPPEAALSEAMFFQ
ncbi:glucose-6-phosphate dehydrogenase assembly protein OpcA [Nibricoccus sp. IMCC34717]|uniref:glucose-6-phosphate dehydrogenase assembly protein OpcA n=1 Tax=Nibricoccus sp. IMCC34717 TaxID=3034021 RepID=UPI00384D94DA